jgi:hypothetical protein
VMTNHGVLFPFETKCSRDTKSIVFLDICFSRNEVCASSEWTNTSQF